MRRSGCADTQTGLVIWCSQANYMYVRFSQHYEVSSILEIQNLNIRFILIFDIKKLNVRVSL